MNNIILQDKMQKILEIICVLYKNDSITDAYIVGSFAKSIIENIPFKESSDIDILIINPLFENPSCELIPEDIDEPVQGQAIKALQEIGASFKNITLSASKQDPTLLPEDCLYFSFVIYKNEVFHVMPFWTKEDIIQMGMMSTYIPISKNDCKSFLDNKKHSKNM